MENLKTLLFKYLKTAFLFSFFVGFWQVHFFAYGFIYEDFFDIPSREDSVVGVTNYEGLYLDPKSIKVMSWNIGKGKKFDSTKCDSTECDSKTGALWEEYLSQISFDYDLVILQETPPFLKLSEHLSEQWKGYGMTMAVSHVSLRKRMYGNAFISRAVPFMFNFKRSEVSDYFFGPPKLITFARFGLKGMEEELLVINIHSLNLAVKGYKRQLQVTQGILQSHEGPVIFAGDFNTWWGRLTLVRKYMHSMGLREVVFENGKDRKYRLWGVVPFGILDHIFVRGLDVQYAQVLNWEGSGGEGSSWEGLGKGSDHKPLSVHLSLDCNYFMHKDCLLAKSAYNVSKTEIDEEN